MPDTVLSALRVLLHLHLMSAPSGRYCFYPRLSGPERVSHLPELTWLVNRSAPGNLAPEPHARKSSARSPSMSPGTVGMQSPSCRWL